MRWLPKPLRRYADFTGRAGRREFVLFALLVLLGFALLIGSTLGYAVLAERSVRTLPLEDNEGLLMLMIVLAFLFAAAMLVPGFALGVGRLHDIDRTGWWMLLPAAMLVLGPFGAGTVAELVFAALRLAVLLIGLVFLCLPGTRGTNRFGPDPRQMVETTA